MYIICNRVILNYFRSAGGWDVQDVTSGMVLVVFLLLLMLLLRFALRRSTLRLPKMSSSPLAKIFRLLRWKNTFSFFLPRFVKK